MGILSRVLRRFVADRREPDKIIGGEDDPYMKRWFILKTPIFSIYLHHFLRSDDDRALHDHPADSISLILEGRYREWIQVKDENGVVRSHTYRVRRPLLPIFRRAEVMHRVQLFNDGERELPVWTLFFFMRRRRDWGFACKQGWVPWQEFCDPDNPGVSGKGCG